MPITLQTGVFNIGRDCQIVVIGATGQLSLPLVTNFQAKQKTATVTSSPLDGRNLSAELPKGWDGSFETDRSDSGVDTFFAAAEQAWVAGGVFRAATLYQYISEANGTTSTFMYIDVSMKLDNAGDWKGDAVTKQTISFMAGQRIEV